MNGYDDMMMERDDAPDPKLRELLALLDPDLDDPGYWHRFHRWVVNSAAPELARRQRAAAVTVGDVVVSWWRTLVPAAALAAGLAAIAIVREAPVEIMATAGIEELLTEGLDPEPLAAGLAVDGSPVSGVAFTSQTF